MRLTPRRKAEIAVLALLLAAAALAAAGCSGRPGPAAGGDEVVLRTYAVPDGIDPVRFQADLRSALSAGDDNRIGEVQLFPDGSLVVTAPLGVQQGVADLIAAAGKRGPRDAAPPQMISIRYWALIARPTAEKGGRLDGALAHEQGLEPVFRELMGAQGPLEFELVEQLRLGSADSSAHLQGRTLRVDQRLLPRAGDAPMAAIGILLMTPSGKPHQLDTVVRLDPGTYVVLGQSGYRGALPEGWRESDDVLLYYVMSADAD